MIDKKDIWVLVAAYNEEQVIGAVLAELKKEGYPILVVDDGSTDRTPDIVRSLGVEMLRHAVNRGKGAALETGMRHLATKKISLVVHFDADGQHSSDDIEALIAPIVNGEADAVFGSRFLGRTENMPLGRRLLLKLGIAFTNLMISGAGLTDVHNGLRAFSSDVFKNIILTEDRFAYASELIEKVIECGARLKEVPVTIRYTPYSLRKGQKNINALYILLRIFMRRYR